MITELVHSASALAVADVAREVNRVAIVSGSSNADLFGPACTPNSVMWTYDSWAMAAALGGGVVRDGGRRWFFVTSDSAGGEVVGRVRVPINTSDMTSFLVQAGSSGADVIALALGGADLINAVKQAQEFQISGKDRRIVSPVTFDTDVHSLGLPAAQHLRGATAFYWDSNDETRAFAKRFAATHRQAIPTMVQAGVYAGLRHYLKAVATASPTDGRAVVAEMKRLPTDDPLFGKGSIRVDGRKLHPMYLFEVKTPAESKGPWDYLKIGATIPVEEAIRPLADGACPLASP